MSRIVPYLQANKLVCYCFLDAGRATRLLGLSQRTLLFMAWQTAWASFNLHWFLMPPNSPGMMQVGLDGFLHTQGVVRQGRSSELWGFTTFIAGGSKPALCWGLGRHYLIPEGSLLRTQPWEMAQVRSDQSLAYWTRMYRDAQGPQLIASPNIHTFISVLFIDFCFIWLVIIHYHYSATGSPFKMAPCVLLICPHHFFEDFLTFWHKVFLSVLVPHGYHNKVW